MANYDLIIVGAGIFGCTVAEQAARDKKHVLVLDKREHIGGNAYAEFDAETGIEVHKYGAHLFHTSDEAVWQYVNKFTAFNSYVHKVYTVHKGEVFPMPINLGTINQFFHANYSPNEARAKIHELAGESANVIPKNLDEQGTKLIGRPLYEAFIMNYTKKQWQTDTKDLSPDIIKRLPVRYNYDNRYFNDKYEGLPLHGYKKLFENMLQSDYIDVKLGVDFFDASQSINKDAVKGNVPVVYTGPIDRYFDYLEGDLSWRTVDFKTEKLDVADFQGTSVVNYADSDTPFTRIIEYKHFAQEREYKAEKTIIDREFSRFATRADDPYYPIGTPEDALKLVRYQKKAAHEKSTYFGGRLGQYKYFDMHHVFSQALTAYNTAIKELK
ncbi:MAG: UDP-galactopyranose mutase [Bifidobacteriaceae bacterium]|jgi:UDP-galactopyranose mutase|nr:UDP-galactopyranose mutase [Bifidobacteriaceae bacterium]